MGSLRTLLLSWNRLGRALGGSAAFPEPPHLPVPEDLRGAVDEVRLDEPTREHARAIQTVLSLLVDREYVALSQMTGGRRLTPQMLETAIESYGRTLVSPPHGLPPDLDIIQDARRPDVSYAAMSLWTQEEGESDLSLELTLTKNRLGLIDVEVDNLHVM